MTRVLVSSRVFAVLFYKRFELVPEFGRLFVAFLGDGAIQLFSDGPERIIRQVLADFCSQGPQDLHFATELVRLAIAKPRVYLADALEAGFHVSHRGPVG